MTFPVTGPISHDISHDSKRNVYDLTPDALAAILSEWGESHYRANQVLHWLYRELVQEFSEMSNLSSALRARLLATFRIGSAELVAQKISGDGWTRKVLLKLRDGTTVEAVLMLYHDRATVCVSSQVGCAMGCSFCATGQMGFTRNLTSGEILEQVIWFNRWLREHPHRPAPQVARTTRYMGKRPPRPALRAPKRDESDWHINSTDPRPSGAVREIAAVTNIVFMGMGEPLLNYNNLWNAIRILNVPQGIGMGARRLTVSTVGVVPKIRQMSKESIVVNLAVSLHAPNDELRSRLVPMNGRYPVAELLQACRDYISATGRRLTFEYVLIQGENDRLEEARELAALLKGMLCHVNLIPLNPVPGTDMTATPRERAYAFQKIVEDAGISTTVRIERGVDIAAACGQLKVEEQPGSRHASLNPELIQAHVQADLSSPVE